MLSAFRTIPLALAAALVALASRGAAQAVTTNTAPQGPRTGMIVGQVIDSTGAPVPEAIVQMSMPEFDYLNLPETPRGRVMADAEGRFFFTDLPAGRYYLRTNKEGYGGGEYRQRRPTGQGQSLTLAEGERLLDAKLPLWKYAVIGGTVVDEAGEPVIGVSVRALARSVAGGRTMYGAEFSYLVPTATTDDRGIFRLSQLMPDRYVIVVPSTQTTVPVALLNTIGDDYLMRTEFSRAIAEIAPLGQPRTQQIGDWALLTLNKVLIPPPASPSGSMEVYKTTYFPAVTTAGAATPIAVGAGEERTDLRIRLRPVPAVRISGRLVTPDGGAPPPTSLRLVGEAAAQVGEEGFETVTGVSDARGRFTLLGVPAGEYTLKHATMLVMNGLQGRPGWWVAQHLTVAGSDMPDLVIAARPALRVEGRLEFRGSTASPPPVPVNLINTGVAFETPNGEPGRIMAQMPKQDRTFSTIAAGSRFIARPYERGGWFVKSVTLDGKDITDRPFDLDADATNIVVTYSDRASRVTGVVKDARGAVAAMAVVLAFPADPERWTGYGTNPRTLKSVNVSRAGEYTLEALPPGDYCLVAIDDADADGWTDPKTLEALARQATKLTIGNEEAKAVDLTMRAIR